MLGGDRNGTNVGADAMRRWVQEALRAASSVGGKPCVGVKSSVSCLKRS